MKNRQVLYAKNVRNATYPNQVVRFAYDKTKDMIGDMALVFIINERGQSWVYKINKSVDEYAYEAKVIRKVNTMMPSDVVDMVFSGNKLIIEVI